MVCLEALVFAEFFQEKVRTLKAGRGPQRQLQRQLGELRHDVQELRPMLCGLWLSSAGPYISQAQLSYPCLDGLF